MEPSLLIVTILIPISLALSAMSSASTIGACAARLMAAACLPRRARSRLAPLAAAVVPAGLSEGALMLVDAVSSARTEVGGGIRDELVCFVSSQYQPPLECPSSSRFLCDPQPLHPSCRGGW
ncbi:hypothetical protein C4D60_Mb04t14880 [Musa balbisiana]|uniref:Uncharacterized protein n=1 Tax=Musa balbisiana TaxID=52838 RepID=A0A4S8KC34_MUSBA|nr:hypothetical protein C4D60_Mb04t14880 [Musa balbisiana]